MGGVLFMFPFFFFLGVLIGLSLVMLGLGISFRESEGGRVVKKCVIVEGGGGGDAELRLVENYDIIYARCSCLTVDDIFVPRLGTQVRGSALGSADLHAMGALHMVRASVMEGLQDFL